MKRIICVLGALLLCQAAVSDAAQTTMAFPKPDQPGTLKIVSGSGDIIITAGTGREVVIESSESGTDVLKEKEKRDEKAKGLRRITMNAFDIFRQDDANAVVVTRPIDGKIDLAIKVPANTTVIIGEQSPFGIGNMSGLTFTGTEPFAPAAPAPPAPTAAPAPPDSILVRLQRNLTDEQRTLIVEQRRLSEEQLKLADEQRKAAIDRRIVIGDRLIYAGGIGSGLIKGDITIRDISGNIEVNALSGSIRLENVSGAVSAGSTEGDITAVIGRVTGESPFAFSSVNGDLDITLPPDLKATLDMQSISGNVYTDFDIDFEAVRGPRSSRSSGFASFSAPSGRAYNASGTINGGGRTVALKTVEGNIYLRRGK